MSPTVGFDADDTLWVNEPHYRAAEKEFCALLSAYLTPEEAAEELYRTEARNLELYGYGAKGFMLSALETALRAGGDGLPAAVPRGVLELGRRLLDFPIEPLPGVVPALKALKPRHRLVLITKGDLLDQERKLKRSGLREYFHHVEILSGKDEEDYRDLLLALGVEPRDFVMVGNSLKSDILPVLGLGGRGVHVPFSVTWRHEEVKDAPPPGGRFGRLDDITGLPALLETWGL